MSTIYGTQTLEGKDYNQNKKMVVLIIADKVNKDLELDEEWFQKFDLRNIHDKQILDDVSIYVVRLDMLNEKSYNEGESDKLQKHMKLIKAKTNEEREEIGKESEELMIIAQTTNRFLTDPRLEEKYNLEMVIPPKVRHS